jgi:hypothetical protein
MRGKSGIKGRAIFPTRHAIARRQRFAVHFEGRFQAFRWHAGPGTQRRESEIQPPSFLLTIQHELFASEIRINAARVPAIQSTLRRKPK